MEPCIECSFNQSSQVDEINCSDCLNHKIAIQFFRLQQAHISKLTNNLKFHRKINLQSLANDSKTQF